MIQLKAFVCGVAVMAMLVGSMVAVDAQNATQPITTINLTATPTPVTATPGAVSLPTSIQPSATTLPGVTMTPVTISNLMGQGESSCMNHQIIPKGKPCCLWKKLKFGKKICLKEGKRYDFSYWEPSELIEVSCRTGYSMLSPGSIAPRMGTAGAASDSEAVRMIQACVGADNPGNQKWFFEARVWAINGYDGGLRHQAMGGTNGERVRQCHRHGDDIKKGETNGYGKKWTQFTRGNPNGPMSSWEAYISDEDPNWALESSGMPGLTTLSKCASGSVDMANCWGPVTKNGWVTHSNPKVAAAIVAWRAHEIARSKNMTSPASEGGGFKMAMEYPYQKYTGPYAASMGFENGGMTGSKCFTPGDAGPEWYNGKQADTMDQAANIATFMQSLTSGTQTTVAEINPGVYVFTIWVKTKCKRYQIQGGSPTPCCKYDFENNLMRWHPACQV